MSPTSAISPLPPTPGSPRVRRLSRPTAPPPGRIDIPKVLSASHFSALASNGPPTNGGAGFPSAPGSNYLSSRPPTPSYYREALADIHAILYAGAFGGGPSGTEGFEEMADCVARWYETDAVFDNPVARSTGRDSIANQFLWMSSVPGERWSEVGDVCECQDFNGNYILILSHTLHVSFFPASDGSHRPPIPTPFHSVPPTPFAYTPAPGTPGTSIVSEHHLHHQLSYGHLPHSRTMSEQNLPPPVDGQDYAASQDDEDDLDDEGDEGDEEETDRGTSSAVYVARNPSHHRGAGAGGTPIGLALAALHPRHVLARLGHYHLRVITRLEFNEQGRVAYHEDHWGVKELVEGTLPLLGQLYYFQRQATGTLGNWLAKRFWMRRAPTAELDDTRKPLETPRTPGTTATVVSPWTTRTPATAGTGITTEGEAGSTTASSVDDGEGGALKQAAERVRRQQKGRGWTPSMGLWSGNAGSRVGQTRDVQGQLVDGVMDLEEGYQSPPPAELVDGDDVTLRSLRRRRKGPPAGRKPSKGKGKADEEVQPDEAESKLSVAQGVYDE